MKILFAAAEGVPFFKTGGLADVIGSLPPVLSDQGLEVRVALPFYRRLARFEPAARPLLETRLDFAGRRLELRVLAGPKAAVETWFFDAPELFDRDHIYGPPGADYPDSLLRFGFFSFAVLKVLPELGFRADVAHVHDWHTAALPVYLRELLAADPFYREMKSVLTIHNLGYQGVFSHSNWPMLGLPDHLFNLNGFEFYNQVNLLKAGLLWADRLTTVSPSYSREIQTPEYGEKLDGLLRQRSSSLVGILNGIDYRYWDPASDRMLTQVYDPAQPDGKAVNKADLERRFGLDPGRPLLGVVSRLVPQKGFELVMEALGDILRLGFNLVILGSGLDKYEEFFGRAVQKFPGRLGFQTGYQEELAHRIYAGSDFFLMPSLYEPCGLGQMIAMRYGTIPVVRRTGGLADSVAEFKSGRGTGFLFDQPAAPELLAALGRAHRAFGDARAWRKLRANAVAADFSWQRSAAEYAGLYRSIS
ncbi:MAG TPA: glycogen synthase GlgA [bacterium]|nr:glycogen synthase GlgA [bacterium]HNS48394.1 glycogen synthase GlgA [bacterium]